MQVREDGNMALNVSQFQSSDNFNMAEFNDMISQINSGVNSEISALTTALNGKAKIQTGSYVGTGTYGSSNPCTLTFDFVLKYVIIQGPKAKTDDEPAQTVFVGECAVAKTNSITASGYTYSLSTWNDKTLTWYTAFSGQSDAAIRYQLNIKNRTYMWIAFG